MIRVIHYLPSINHTSGVAQLLMRYYRKMNKNLFQFHFVYFTELKDKNFKKEIIKLGGTEEYICPPNNYFQFKKDFNNYIANFRRKYKNDKIVFHNHQLPFTIFQYGILKKNSVNNIIVHNHMTKFSEKKLSAFRNMLLFLPISFMDVEYFSCSKDACNLISKYNFVNKQKIFILRNSINCSEFKFNQVQREEMRKKLHIGGDYLLGNIGHFEAVKNQSFIIKLFYKKFNKNGYKLILVGDGSKKELLLKNIEKYNLKERVIILENRDDIPNILSSMDCFLFPSKFEGLGIVSIEAQASGLPVILSKNIPLEVSIKNCTIQQDYNINSWAKSIENLKSQNIDRLLANIEVSKSEYNIDRNVAKLEKKYESIINRVV